VVLIWGSTWLAITYQFGEVDPTLSVAYRFFIAATILFVYCKIKKLSLDLPKHIHIKMAAVGLCLYTLDYTLLYQSQQYIISAIVALMSSGMVYINVLLRRVLLKKPIRKEVMAGATLGMFGIGLIFLPEFAKVSANQYLLLGISLALTSFFFASLGNVLFVGFRFSFGVWWIYAASEANGLRQSRLCGVGLSNYCFDTINYFRRLSVASGGLYWCCNSVNRQCGSYGKTAAAI
jgi:drug/metabolite transporter (DMT)-like permease